MRWSDEPIVAYKLQVPGVKGWSDSTKEAFTAVRMAATLIEVARRGEQRFDLLLQNMITLETSILGAAVALAMFPGKRNETIAAASDAVNLHLTNFLSTARIYRDHARCDLKIRFGEQSPEYLALTAAAEKKEKGPLSYRFIEQLRNYGQHRELPVSASTLSLNLEVETAKIEHSMMAQLDLDDLRDDPKLKKLIDELKPSADKNNHISLMPFVRQYLESVTYLQGSFRDMLRDQVQEAKATLTSVLTVDGRTFEEGELLAVDANERPVDSQAVRPEAVERLESLIAANSGQRFLGRAVFKSV